MKLNSTVATIDAVNRAFCAIALLSCVAAISGCSLVPETRFRDSLHNPFPQIKRVAVLPFYNQSSEPSVDGDAIAEAYYAELQSIPGFEVLPVGVTKAQWFQYASVYGEPRDGKSFQHLAQVLGVEAVVVGSVTDFDMYYPPRLAMTVHWYAANEGFHPIPAGYGLPWGTEAEKEIPRRIVREAEFELARSQLATQSPQGVPDGLLSPVSDESSVTDETALPANSSNGAQDELDRQNDIDPRDGRKNNDVRTDAVRQTSHDQPQDLALPMDLDGLQLPSSDMDQPRSHDLASPTLPSNVLRNNDFNEGTDSAEIPAGYSGDDFAIEEIEAPLPPHWPNPTDLIPDPPSPHPAPTTISHEPVLSHTKIYRANDPYFTKRLGDYVETGDDARPGGWQGYLKRSDDFIRFCCHLHIAEMLESRGGTDQSDLILRWPLSRY